MYYTNKAEFEYKLRMFDISKLRSHLTMLAVSLELFTYRDESCQHRICRETHSNRDKAFQRTDTLAENYHHEHTNEPLVRVMVKSWRKFSRWSFRKAGLGGGHMHCTRMRCPAIDQ